MRRVIVTEYVSVDGVIEDPGGAEQFEQAASSPRWSTHLLGQPSQERKGVCLGSYTHVT
jgi:hypothetical protein